MSVKNDPIGKLRIEEKIFLKNLQTHSSTMYVFFLLAPTGNRRTTETRTVHLLVLKGHGRFGGIQCLHLGMLTLKMKVN